MGLFYKVFEQLQNIDPGGAVFIILGSIGLLITIVMLSSKIRETAFFKGVFNIQTKKEKQRRTDINENLEKINENLEKIYDIEEQQQKLFSMFEDVKGMIEHKRIRGLTEEEKEELFESLNDMILDLHKWHDKEDVSGRKIWYQDEDVDELINDIFETNRRLIGLLRGIIYEIDEDLKNYDFKEEE